MCSAFPMRWYQLGRDHLVWEICFCLLVGPFGMGDWALKWYSNLPHPSPRLTPCPTAKIIRLDVALYIYISCIFYNLTFCYSESRLYLDSWEKPSLFCFLHSPSFEPMNGKKIHLTPGKIMSTCVLLSKVQKLIFDDAHKLINCGKLVPSINFFLFIDLGLVC